MFDSIQDRELMGRAPLGYGGLFYGVYPALVTNIVDPAAMGQVQVQLPWSPDTGEGTYQVWARLSTLMAGNSRGTWFIPEVGDEVLVTFAAGNPRYPILLGALWNGKDAPPVAMDQEGKNAIKQIRSRSGIEITLDDTQDKATLSLTTPGKQQAVFTDDGDQKGLQLKDSTNNALAFKSQGVSLNAGDACTIDITDGNKNTVTMASDGITLHEQSGSTVTLAAGKVTMQAAGHQISIDASGITLQLSDGATMQLGVTGFSISNVPMASVQAEGSLSLTAGSLSMTGSDVSISGSMIGLTAGLIDAAGVINCPTIIAEAVVGTSYAPGAGNIL